MPGGLILWEQNGLIFAVGPWTCSGPSGSLGAPKKGAQDPAAKWAVIRTPAELLLSPSCPSWTILWDIPLLFHRCLKPLTLLGPQVMIWPHETTSSAVDSSCNIFASWLSFIFSLFHRRYYRPCLYHWDPINDCPIPGDCALRKWNLLAEIVGREKKSWQKNIRVLAFFEKSIYRMKTFLKDNRLLTLKQYL